MSQLPEVLAAVRAHASLTLAGLAEKVGGITKQGLGHYEKGIRQPDPRRIAEIAAVCGVTISCGPDAAWRWSPSRPRKRKGGT